MGSVVADLEMRARSTTPLPTRPRPSRTFWPRSLHIDWTAWGDVGMAVRGGMQSLLEGRGVQLLPADAGAEWPLT